MSTDIRQQTTIQRDVSTTHFYILNGVVDASLRGIMLKIINLLIFSTLHIFAPRNENHFMSGDLFRNKYRIDSARADWHDYNHGYYFITICTNKREHFFGEIHDHKMAFSTLGNFANSYIDKINVMYKDVQILSHVVMPNHVHLIVDVDNTVKRYTRKRKAKNNIDTNEDMSKISKRCGRLSNIVSKYKSSVTTFALKNDIPFMWQSRFHDRIIRDYKEFENVDNYIKNNVFNWNDDEYRHSLP